MSPFDRARRLYISTFYSNYGYFSSAGIYPDPPGGGYNPPVFMRHPPNHLKFKGGYQGGVYGGCLCDRDGMGN